MRNDLNENDRKLRLSILHHSTFLRMQNKSFTVCVTGAAGQIAYAFLPQLCKGIVFPGADIHLRLLDVTPVLKVMQGVAMELDDCSFPTLKSVQRLLVRSSMETRLSRCSRMLIS